MVKLAGIACAIVFLFVPAKLQNERFSRYKRVEAYEVDPGILMMPRYSMNGQVCMVVLQKDHYVNGAADLDSSLPREVITKVLDELVPPSERGPLSTNEEMARLSVYAGNGVTSLVDYKNVSFDISRQASSPGDIIAVVQWRERSCQ
jgi:hypothetical protein